MSKKREKRPPWEQPGWADEIEDWIQTKLVEQGLRQKGPITEVKYRPWSAVLRIPTIAGDYYFKASLPVLTHEVPVTIALSQWRPDLMLPILAADPERGWLLLPDGGTILRSIITERNDYKFWEKLLPVYAEFQLEMAGRVPELLALGEPDRRLARLPSLYKMLLEDRRILRINQDKGLTATEYRALQDLSPHFEHLCQELASYHIPESLHHGDFHDGNIFFQDGRYVIFDWGDSAVSHPFYSLRNTFVSLYFTLNIDDGAPELHRLRDIYLEGWSDFGSPARLRKAFKLAQRLAAVSGALVWHRIISAQEGSAWEDYAEPVPSLLREFLEFSNEVSET